MLLSSPGRMISHTYHQIMPSARREPTLCLLNSGVAQKLYDSILEEQEKCGFIKKVNNDTTSGVHYLPHRPVKKDSITMPIRIVYDCSCQEQVSSASLNDCLMVVPNNLCAILLRFRGHKFRLSTDIEKGFLYVQLHNDDRNYTRFLWPTLSEQPDRYTAF